MDLHHDLQLAVLLRALPARDEVQHMHALVALPGLLALRAHELDAPRREARAPGARVDHLDQPRVEVDLRRQRRDRHQRRRADRQDRRHRLVEEALVAVRRLLQDQDVPARALRRPDLRSKRVSTCSLPARARIYALDTTRRLRFLFINKRLNVAHLKKRRL
jgi:hypothetical protein